MFRDTNLVPRKWLYKCVSILEASHSTASPTSSALRTTKVADRRGGLTAIREDPFASWASEAG